MAYKFNNRFCIIEIEDMKFRAQFGKKLIDDITAAKNMLAELQNDGFSDNDKVCAAIDKAIDGILGKGAAKKIFAQREQDCVERLDVLTYIFNETTVFMNRIAGEANVFTKGTNH